MRIDILKGEYKMKKNTISIFLTLLLVFLVGSTAIAAENDWKWERSVELVCPFGSGGGTDTSLRAIQPFLEKELGVSIIINNKPGSAGLVGAEYFINQPNDGYSWLMITPSHTVNEVRGDMSFKILEDTESVCILNVEDYVLMAPADAPYNDFLELKKYVDEHPDEVTVACISMGGADEFALNSLMSETGMELTLVPYSSGAEQISALLGGFVSLILSSPSEGAAYIESGHMKALGVFGQERNEVLPDVKSCKDLGLRTNFVTFRGIIGKKGIPEGALQSMCSAFARAVEAEEWKTWLKNNGLKSDAFGSAEEMTELYKEMLEAVRIAMNMSETGK
jgi:tripartite-type tricarboxylate transporter receptor subunit TctC